MTQLTPGGSSFIWYIFLSSPLTPSPGTLNPAYVPPRSLDVSVALACPGVVDVITAEDVPGENDHNGEILYAQSEVCGL